MKNQFEQALAEARKLDNTNIRANFDDLDGTVEHVAFRVLHEVDMIEEGEYDLDGVNRRSQNAYLKHALAFLEKWGTDETAR